jgi:hypothetical protein
MAEFGPRAVVRSCLKHDWAACTIAMIELPNNRGRATGAGIVDSPS